MAPETRNKTLQWNKNKKSSEQIIIVQATTKRKTKKNPTTTNRLGILKRMYAI